MKNIIFLLSVMMVGMTMTSCETKQSTIEQTPQQVDFKHNPPIVVVIDSCEYLAMHTAYSFYVYTHKGNFSNPIHRQLFTDQNNK